MRSTKFVISLIETKVAGMDFPALPLKREHMWIFQRASTPELGYPVVGYKEE